MKGTNSLAAIRLMSTPDAYRKMLGDIRGWGWAGIVLGAIHLVAGRSLNLSFGLLMLAIGALSFLVRESPMYVLYAVVIAWAGIGNLAGVAASTWTIFGLFQLVISVQIFQRYFLFRKVEKDYRASPPADQPERESVRPSRTEQAFPLASLLAGVGGLAGSLFGFGTLILLSAAEASRLTNVAGQATEISMVVGVLGFALGLASLLSGAPNRALSILGTVAGGLAMLMGVGLMIAGRILA